MSTTKSKHKVAVIVHDQVELFSILPLIPFLDKLYNLDVITDSYKEFSAGHQQMAASTKDILKKHHIPSVDIKVASKKKYDLLLAAYHRPELSARCKIRFPYGSIGAKPSLSYSPTSQEVFHAFLCIGTPEADILNVYGRTHIVENLRFINFRKQTAKAKKKTVLFTPTYNDELSASDLRNLFRNLKKKYHIITKLHHGTNYRPEHQAYRELLEDLSDECYDANTSLADLFARADMLLCDNSAAYSDACYVGLPCAIFCQDLHKFDIANITSTQEKLIARGIIPYTNKVKDIESIISKALSPSVIKKQQESAKVLFPAEYRTGTQGYLDIINYYLECPNIQDYIDMHNYLYELRQQTVNNISAELSHIVEEKNHIIDEINKELSDYRSGKLYKISNKIYKAYSKVKPHRP